MSANNASLYASAKEEIEKPTQQGSVGAKASKILESAGPIQPPIGQAAAGAAKDIADTAGVDVTDLLLTGGGLYALKKMWDKFGPKDGGGPPNTPPPSGPVAPTTTPVPTPATAAVPPVDGAISREQAAAHVAAIPEHPNPITKIEPSTLSQIGASNTAQQTKEIIASQKKVKGAIAPELQQATDIAKSTAVAEFKRDAKGNIQWPDKMSPAAKAGAEAFATQFPDIAKQLESEGRFGILGAGKGDNNLYNSYGADFAKVLRNEVNQGQMVGTYGNYKNAVNPAIGQIPPESPVGQQLAALRASQPEGGTHGPLGQGAAVKEGKLITAKNALNPALKGGAAAALLMSISNAANAREAARNVGEALLPWGMTPSEVQSGTLTAKQLKAFEEAQKLGSPYRAVPPPR